MRTLKKLVKRCCNGLDTIAVVGGDGTLSETAEGSLNSATIRRFFLHQLSRSEAGDTFRRGQETTLPEACARAEHHYRAGFEKLFTADGTGTPQVDVLYGRCNDLQKGFICINASTMGIGGETASRVASHREFMRRFPGEVRFALARLVQLAVCENDV
jgi:diacylglycerol kinase family enzyme